MASPFFTAQDLAAFQNQVFSNDPYAQVGKAAGSWQPNTTTWSPTELGVSSLLQGFLGGFGTGAGQQRSLNQAQTVMGILPQLSVNPMSTQTPEGIDPMAFQALQQTAAVNKQAQDAALKEQERLLLAQEQVDLRKTFATQALQNPAMFRRALKDPVVGPLLSNVFSPGKTQGVKSIEQQLLAKPAQVEVAQEQAPDIEPTKEKKEFEPDRITRKTQEIAEAYMEQGIPPGQAMEAARQQVGNDRLELRKQYESVMEAAKSSRELNSLADNYEQELARAGDTGPAFGQIKQTLSAITGLISPSQAEKRSGGERLKAMQNEIVGVQGRAFKGPMSDRDVKIMLQAAPGVGYEESTNRRIVDNWRKVANMQGRYVDFMAKAREEDMDPIVAEAEWNRLREANPYVVRQGNKLEINPFWTGEQAPNQLTEEERALPMAGAEEDPTMLGQYVEGVMDTPNQVRQLVDPNTYQQMFKDTETGIGSVGRMGAMTAGGIAGAAKGASLGAFFGPIGAAVGGLAGAGIGAGVGALGFDKILAGAATVAGVEKEGETIIPTRDEMLQTAKLSGSATGLGALAKGVGTAAKAVKSTAQVAPKSIAAMERAATERMIPKTTGELKASYENKPIYYVDDAGREVPASEAAEALTAIEKAQALVEKTGIIDKLTNNPKANKVLFDNAIFESGQTLKGLHKEASALLDARWQKLSPAQKAQYPIVRDPKTGKGGHEIDFSSIEAQIRGIGKTDANLVAPLMKNLNALKKGYNQTGRTYNDLNAYRESIGGSTKWESPTEAVSKTWNALKKDAYSLFADKQKQVFDGIMSLEKPEMVGALSKANAQYHAFSTLEPMISKSAAAGPAKLKLGVLETPRSLIQRYPATARNFAKSVQGTGNAITRAFEPVTTPLQRAFGAATGTVEGRALLAAPEEPRERQPVILQQEVNPLTALFGVSDAPAAVEPQQEQSMPASANLLNAIIKAESAGKPDAVSKAGAQGLMQLMPPTFNEWAKKIGIEKPNIKDPEQNKAVGAAYFNHLLEKYNNDEKLALAAYNYGLGNVDKLIKRHGYNFDKIEKYLPKETRAYVPRVLNYAYA